MDDHRSLHDMINLRELEIFVAINETKSISAASRREGISQSAASQLVQKLEQRMQLTLLDRSARPLRLTPDGHEVVKHATTLLEEAKRFLNCFAGDEGRKSLSLRLGVVETLSLPFIPRLVEALGSRLDQMTVTVGSSNQQRTAFLERRLDVMIMSDPMDDLEDVESHLIAEEPFILLVPRGRVVEDVKDLQNLAQILPMIRFGHRSAARSNIDAQLKRMRVPILRHYEIDTPDTVVGMVSAGLGWAVTTPLSVRSAWKNPEELELLRFPGAQFQRKLYLATRKHELGDFPKKLVSIARNILRDHYVSGIADKESWLRQAIHIPYS